MALQIREVLACLTVPDFDLFVDLSAREKNYIVNWIEANRTHYCLMTRKCHLEDFMLRVLVKVWANEQLYEPVIRPRRNQMLRPRPVNAINAAHVMVLLLNNHLQFLNAIFLAHLRLNGLIVRLYSLNAPRQSTDLQRL